MNIELGLHPQRCGYLGSPLMVIMSLYLIVLPDHKQFYRKELMLSPHSGSFTASDEHSNTCNDESDYAPEFWKAADEQHEGQTIASYKF